MTGGSNQFTAYGAPFCAPVTQTGLLRFGLSFFCKKFQPLLTKRSFLYKFGSSKITVIFSDIITYISKNITLKWQPDENDEDGELIVSGGAKESFNMLYDKLNEKGAFFNNSFNANLITDIWYEFLNNSIS